MSPEFEHQDGKPEQPEVNPASHAENLYCTIESLHDVTDETRAHLIHVYVTDFATKHNRQIAAGEEGPVIYLEEFEAKVTAAYEKLRKERGG